MKLLKKMFVYSFINEASGYIHEWVIESLTRYVQNRRFIHETLLCTYNIVFKMYIT